MNAEPNFAAGTIAGIQIHEVFADIVIIINNVLRLGDAVDQAKAAPDTRCDKKGLRGIWIGRNEMPAVCSQASVSGMIWPEYQ